MIETALFLLDGKCSKLKVKNFGSFEKVVGVIENYQGKLNGQSKRLP